LARREFFVQAQGSSEWPDGMVSAHYRFLHALYQEVLYSRVTPGRRVELHRRIGEREEQAYRQRAHEIAAELAVHFEQGRDYRKAVQYLHLAGANATRRSAHKEAISLLTKGLEWLKTLPDTSERTQQELALHITLGTPLQATRGFSSPEVGAAYGRARELCQQVGETRQLFLVLNGLRTFHQVRGELLPARELAEQLLGLAQREQDPTLLVVAYWAVGSAFFYLGELGTAQTHLEQSLILYHAQRHSSQEFLLSGGIEPGVFGLSWTAFVLWQLGYPAQALQQSQAARTLAEALSYPLSLAGARVLAAQLHQLRREGPLTQEWAEAAITLVHEQGFPGWLGRGAILQGWALAEQGQVEEGIAQMRHGLATCQAIGVGTFHSYSLALLAEAYGKAGQPEDGLATLAEALALVDKSGERFYEAELYRLRGELTLHKSRVGIAHQERTVAEAGTVGGAHPTADSQVEADACFLKAIEISRQQQAKSLELRAVMSLARLWHSQGKKAEAHQMLAEIYNWFTEGFDTKDLQEAKALLEELA
jgi:predicted ATPase